MRKMKNSLLLREYVRNVLISEDGTYFGAAEGPYGMSFSDAKGLMDTFITPFTDVFKTAVGKTKEVAASTKNLLVIGFQSIITTLFPFIGADYEENFKQEKEEIAKIKSEYKDVYDRTDKALRSDDAGLIAFLAYPQFYMAGHAVKHGSKMTLELLSALTGGASDKLFADTKESLKKAGKWEDTSKKRKSESIYFSGDLISEKSGSEEGQGNLYNDETLLSDPSFLKAALNSPEAKEIRDRAKNTYKTTLKSIEEHSKKILKDMNSIEDIKNVLLSSGESGTSKAEVQKTLDNINRLQGAQKEKAVQELIKGIREATKKFYVKNLSDHVKKAISSGIPESSAYVADYKRVIQKISSM